MDQTKCRFPPERLSPHFLPSRASFLSSSKCGKYKVFFFLHICVYFLLVKPRSVLSADGCLGSPDIPPRGLQSERTEKRSLPSFVQFALHLSSYRGSHDITFLPSPLSLCSSSFFFFFFVQFCFTLLPVLYLKNNFKPRPCEYIRNEAYFDRVQYISHSDMDMQTGSNVQQVMIRDICAFGCTMGFSGWVIGITVSQFDCSSVESKICGNRLLLDTAQTRGNISGQCGACVAHVAE